jgi:hypothetical protein
MRTLRLSVSAALIAGAALFGLASPAGAASSADRTYAGTLSGPVVFTGCLTTPPSVTVTGDSTWTTTVHGASAKAAFTIFTNDSVTPHVQYVFPGMKLSPIGSNVVFSASGLTGAGRLVITLYQDGAFTYVISPYTYSWDNGATFLECASVTYSGTAGS